MSRQNILIILLALGMVLLVSVAPSVSGGIPSTHPAEIEAGSPVLCSDCHEATDGSGNYQKFNHTPMFLQSHRMQVYQNEMVCAMCHSQNFCSGCHAMSDELKPSLKNQSEVKRAFQHRGDYLSRHRIDGRMNPAGCYRCHGNPKSSETCMNCHR